MLFFLEKINPRQVAAMKWKFATLSMLILRLAALQAETVEIVSDMYTEEILADACFKKIRNAYEVRITDQEYHLPITSGDIVKCCVLSM